MVIFGLRHCSYDHRSTQVASKEQNVTCLAHINKLIFTECIASPWLNSIDGTLAVGKANTFTDMLCQYILPLGAVGLVDCFEVKLFILTFEREAELRLVSLLLIAKHLKYVKV